MSFGIFRFSILGAELMLMVGCGGSGGGSGTGGSGGGNNSTTVKFIITGGTPTAVATQIGSGSFSAATLSGGKVTLNLPSGTTSFGVAYICPPYALQTTNPQSITYQYVFEVSSLDLSSLSGSCPTASSTGTTGTLTGSVDASAISGASHVDIDAQSGSAPQSMYGTGLNANFSFSAPPGSDRVEVLAFNSVMIGIGQTISLVAAKNFSGQAVPGALNGGDTVTLGAADETTPEAITYNSVPAGYSAPTTQASYFEVGGDGFMIAIAATTVYPALPASATESGDYYYLLASAYSTSSFGSVFAVTTQASAGPVSFTFPPTWSYAGPAAATWPSFDLSYKGFSGKTGGCNQMNLQWLNSSTLSDIYFVATANYLNGSTTVAVPDLAGIPGFLNSPATGTEVQWSAAIYQNNYECLLPVPLNGTVVAVSDSGSYTAP